LTLIAKLKLPALSPFALHVGVWQISSQSDPAQAGFHGALDSNQNSWVVTTARQAKVSVHRGLSLRHVLDTSLGAFEADLPSNPVQSFKSAISLTLLLPDHYFHTFQMPCMPQWGPQDIEAESRLEAARLMRLPMENLSLDFEVQAMPNGALLAQVMACESSMVQDALALFEKLGFQLNSLTSHSDLNAHAQAWRVSPDLVRSLVQGSAVAC